MAAEPAAAAPSTATPAEKPSVNLQIVSPSVGAGSPLQLVSLAIETTVKDLKARIRQALPALNPGDDDQRLIYQGRALRDHDTLRDIFGEAAVC